MDKDKEYQFYISCARRVPKASTIKYGKRNVLCSRCLINSPQKAGDIYDIWGMYKLDAQEYSKSINKLKKALAINPSNANTWEDLGKAQLALGNDEEGLRSLKVAMSITPSDFLHKALIKALYERGRADEIPEIYRELTNIIPSGTNRGYFYYAASLVLQDFGLNTFALDFLRIVIFIFPNRANFYLAYGRLLRKEGLLEEAIVAFKEAIAIEESYHNFNIDVAMLRYNQGEVLSAIEELEAAAAETTHQIDDSIAFYLVFMRYHLSQDESEIEKEIEQLIRALELGNNVFSQELSEELQVAQLKLENQLDEKTKEFTERKIKALKYILSWVEEYHKN